MKILAKRLSLTRPFTWIAFVIFALSEVTIPIQAVVVGMIGVVTVSEADARTLRGASRRTGRRTVRRSSYRRYPAVRPVARGTVRRTTRRTVRRTTRRISRRHYFGLPAGYRVYPYGRYRYYYYGGLYYYPYMYSGRTIYIQIDVNDSNQPLPPPPSSTVMAEININ